jgi:hypothetical protein
MANCVPYTLKVVAKDKEILERLFKIMNYHDKEYYIYRVYDVDVEEDEPEFVNGYYVQTFFGNVAWGASPWINDKEDKEDKESETGAHYTTLVELAKKFDFGFELFYCDEKMMYQKYWRVNHLGHVVDAEYVDNWEVTTNDETGEIEETGGLDYYEEFSEPKEVFELEKDDLNT